MAKINSNLPADAQPWGRDIDNRLTTVEAAIDANTVNDAARDKQFNNNIKRISEALIKIKTSSTSGHKRFSFNGGSLPTFPTVLEFEKPAWATSATILATAFVNADTLYSGGYGNTVAGTLRMFINGEEAVYSAYDFGGSGGYYEAPNVKYLSITAPVDAEINGSVSLSHSSTIPVTSDTLKVWASYANTPTNIIPPTMDFSDPWWDEASDYDPLFTNAEVWGVGLNAANSCSVEIMATIFWNAE
jgi:hypothetical protein